MAIRRKVSHHSQIKGKTRTSLSSVGVGDIIEFKYSGKNIYDNRPMVVILEKKGDLVKAININYLTEYRVQQLLQEVNLKKMPEICSVGIIYLSRR